MFGKFLNALGVVALRLVNIAEALMNLGKTGIY